MRALPNFTRVFVPFAVVDAECMQTPYAVVADVEVEGEPAHLDSFGNYPR